MEDAEANGYWATRDVFCRAHLLDEFLFDTSNETRRDEPCVVCGRLGGPVVLIDDFLETTMSVLKANWSRAIEGLMRDSESDSGYAFAVPNDTADIVRNEFDAEIDEGLLVLVQQLLIDDLWYEPRTIWLEGRELLKLSWQQFRDETSKTVGPIEQVVLRRRGEYEHPEADGIAPAQLLDEIATIIVDHDLISEVSVDHRWYRATHLRDGELTTARRLGTAPASVSSQANRWSPPSVSMFYGATDYETAAVEIGSGQAGTRLVVGIWVPSRPLRLLDLTKVAELPSYFDLPRRGERYVLEFLGDFVADVSRPIRASAREVEYRPTQLLTMFLKRQLPDLDGITYRSSRNGQVCCVLFVDNNRCVEPDQVRAEEDPLSLRLVRSTSGVGWDR